MMTRWRPQRLGHSWLKVLSSNHNDIICTASSLSSLISPLLSPLLSDTSHLIFHLISHLSLSSSSPRDATVIGEECVARHLWRVQRCRLSKQLMFSENRVHTTCLPEMSCSLLSECHWRPLECPAGPIPVAASLPSSCEVMRTSPSPQKSRFAWKGSFFDVQTNPQSLHHSAANKTTQSQKTRLLLKDTVGGIPLLCVQNACGNQGQNSQRKNTCKRA